MFRVGSKNGFTIYWSDPTGQHEDRFVATATSREVAEDIADALNDVHSADTALPPEPIGTCPIVPRRSQDG